MNLLPRYAGADYEDVVYECGDAPDFDRSAWMDVKFNLGLEFPNLPYLDLTLGLSPSSSIVIIPIFCRTQADKSSLGSYSSLKQFLF